jgi:hypothetical protein
MSQTAPPTLREARKQYFEENAFGEDGGYNARWVRVDVGPVPFFFPNTAARVRAVRLHDLHHLLTGYRTDFPGESEISAWEIGGGCKGFMAAWVLNLMGMGAGLFFQPRKVAAAFFRGRHTGNLYGTEYGEALLESTVGEMKQRMSLDTPVPAPDARAKWAFAGWSAASLVAIALAAVTFLAPPAALAWALARLLG